MELSSLTPAVQSGAQAPYRPTAPGVPGASRVPAAPPGDRPAPTEEKEPSTGLVREAAPESRAEVERLVEEADQGLKVLNERLGFQVHEDSGQLFVQVVDRETGEVIRESPPEEFLDLIVRMREMVGVFLDETR